MQKNKNIAESIIQTCGCKIMPGSLGTPELLIILVIALLILGPTKLPRLARALGESVREFRKASSGLLEEEKASLERMSVGGSLTDEDRKTLYRLAEKLGLETRGLSDREILERLKEKASAEEEK